MQRVILGFLAFCFAAIAHAQTNVRAWCTNGQVWVVWSYDTNNSPETFAIYAGTNNFTDVSQATLVGRLFGSEWSGGNLKAQMDAAFGVRPSGYRVPTPAGTFYTLAANEGLFAYTVRTTGTNIFAVVPWGQTTVSNVNRSPVVRYAFDVNDPPRPQLQGRGPSISSNPTATNMVSIFILFVDGDADVNAGRADFPIFANHHKRGSPHLFLTVEPSGGLPGSGPWPATMCFHGANGDAIEWLPNKETARSINVAPRDGYVLGFDDEVFSLINTNPFGYNTRWIGYVPSFDPFTNVVGDASEGGDISLTSSYATNNPPADQTIINYTQRRILWVLDWLIANANVDSNHVSLLGHSAGSMGAQSIARAFPERFSSVQLFNCGMRYYIGAPHAARMGDAILNLPVTVTNHLGQQVHLLDLLFFTNRVAAPRDLPFFRLWHGKCDDNGAMHWGSDMLDQVRFCDREAWGLTFYWDLRNHGLNNWLDFWVNATDTNTLALQTQRDDVRNQTRYFNNQSYPAFFNVQHYANHGEPGPGYIGSTNPAAYCVSTNGYNGDDQGTWGGYYDWETTNIVDTPTNWQCTVFLVGTNSGYAPVDVSSNNATLISDIAVRRPQQFLPPPGTLLNWEVRRIDNNALLQSGTTAPDTNGLVMVTNVSVLRDPSRVRLSVFSPNGFMCGDTNLPGNWVRHVVIPTVTDSRITGKNATETAFISSNAPLRNQLVVFFPGTGGVPISFDNFCQNAANLGFHALALTYDNDTSSGTFCGTDPNLDCFYNLRYEFLTGSNTSTKTNIMRANSIEFRLAAFLNYLNTNYPAENWGQYLVATNNLWANALAWNKYLLAGHSQGAGYAAFIAKLHEVQRVVTFGGGDFDALFGQAAPWNFLPPATPVERWFGFTHYKDPGEFDDGQQIPNWEAQDFVRFGPVVDLANGMPPYNYTHIFTTTLEPCPNVNGDIEYHSSTINDPPQLRYGDGTPFYATLWTHMLIGPMLAPTPPNLIADSVRDFSSTQGASGWRYGFWNRTADPNGSYQAADFTPLPTFSNTLYAIPSWILSNDLEVAVWLTGARAHGVNTNLCCTNHAGGPELWPVRRWVSTASGPVTIAGWLSKWDSAGGDGVTGLIKVNGVTVWSALIDGTNIFGTNFSVAVNLNVGSFVDFLVSPGMNADQDGARFTGQIIGPPPLLGCAMPTLYARLLTNSALELRWETCTNYDYQLEASFTLMSWQKAGPPLPAPPGGGWLTNVVSATNPYSFFRVRADLLTNSPVPSLPGQYTNLFFTHDGILRSYRLMIPTNYNPAASNAFAFILHGHTQTADSFASLHPALFFHAQTNGMILVLPDSTEDERGTGWNNSDPVPGAYQVNDVSFLLALLDRIGATLNLDEHRLYAGGFSSGGVMCHYLGARTTNVFAALAAVEASIGADKGTGTIVTNPPAAGPMPVLIMNCTNSCARPYFGGLSDTGAQMTAAVDAAYYWTNANLCAATMTATTNNFVTNGMYRFNNCDNKPPANVPQPNQVITMRWPTCALGTEVIFVTLTDGGHTWPDAGDNLGFDANAEVPKFFLRHALP